MKKDVQIMARFLSAHCPPPPVFSHYKHVQTGETVNLTPEAEERYFANRDPADWLRL